MLWVVLILSRQEVTIFTQFKIFINKKIHFAFYIFFYKILKYLRIKAMQQIPLIESFNK